MIVSKRLVDKGYVDGCFFFFFENWLMCGWLFADHKCVNDIMDHRHRAVRALIDAQSDREILFL